MELIREHFDKQLGQLNKRLDVLVSKDDLNIALQAQTKELESYTNAVASGIIDAVDNGFTAVNDKLDSREEKLQSVEKELQEMKGALHLS